MYWALIYTVPGFISNVLKESFKDGFVHKAQDLIINKYRNYCWIIVEKAGEDVCSVAGQFTAILLFCSPWKKPCGITYKWKLISSICTWTCKMRTRSLCYRLNTHVGLCAWVCVCVPCTRPPTIGEPDWQPKIPERSNHRSKQMHTHRIRTLCTVLTWLCQQLHSESCLPLGSLNIDAQSHWKLTEIFMFSSISAVLLQSVLHIFSYTCSNESMSLESSLCCLQT